jgi:hypothetical protein
MVLDPECDNGDDHIRDKNDESEESKYSGGGHRHHQSASWFPSQIDVAISSGVGIADASTTTLDSNTIRSNQIKEMMMDDFQSSSESVDDDLSHHEASHSPPERIRYELLGAPTLLYRHAPSYLCPSHRPSTLSPQQIFMALYTKDHPVKDWFGPKSMTAHSNNQCPFLSCTNVPYPARPWGCTSTTLIPPPDSSDDQTSDKKEEAKSRHQQMVDEPNKIRNGEKESAISNNITSNGEAETGRRQSKRMKDETKTNAPKKKRTSAFSVYRQEVSIKRKEEGFIPPAMKELGILWKAIADAEKSRYQQMADEYNSNCMGEKQRKFTTAFIVYRKELGVKCKEEGCSGPKMTEVANRWKKVSEEEKARYQQMADEYNSNCMGEKQRKSSTSAFIVYRKELGVKCKEKGCSGPKMTEVANRWKKVPEEEKARYQQMADEYNANRIGKQKNALNSSNAIDIEVETESALPNNEEDGMIEKAQKQRKSSTSAFDVFGKDLSNSCKEEGCSRPQTKDVANRRKKISEEDKARCQPMADEQNAMNVVNAGNDSFKDEDMKSDEVVDTSSEYTNIPIILPISNMPVNQVVPNEVGGPSGFGNCLITIPCQCHHCNLRQPSWFLVHPTGDNLSRMAMSKLSLPRGVLRRVDQTVKNVLEIGGSILQISQCGPRLKSTDGIMCLVARTSQHCSIVYAHPTNIMTSKEQEECRTNYELQEKARIDMSYCPSKSFHLPAYIACDPKTTVSYFTCPSIAILSRDDPERCTTIHRVIVRDGDEPTVKVHSFSASLSDISMLEFCSDDRLSLWAAARSTTMPKLAPGCK